MPKNIVICCDGTDNKFRDNNTNVVKLFSVLDLDDPSRQVAYYHAGLGTMGAPNALTRVARWWTKLLGLAFGYGLLRDIADAYGFLMQTFEPGDNVYLFGFSRGAYTVRALSGMLHMVGLLRRGNDALVPYAEEMIRRPKDELAFELANEFKQTFSRECKLHFIGVWDTVSSVGWVWDPLHIPYTARDPDMSIGRHAVSIDERRCFFRQNLWGAPLQGQDIKQVWFAGVHCDVGGGYPQNESGLSQIALEWMLREALLAGLRVTNEKVVSVLHPAKSADGVPNALADTHQSLAGPWLLLEIFPHKYYDNTCTPPRMRWRIPLGQRRRMAPDAVIHESVVRRMKEGSYQPSNLPAQPAVEPWVPWGQPSARTASAPPG